MIHLHTLGDARIVIGDREIRPTSPVVFAALAGLFYVGMQREDPDALPSQLIGKVAPPVTVQQLGETPLLTDELLQGPGVKLVNFWGTWCVACRAEHPTLLWMNDNLDVPLYIPPTYGYAPFPIVVFDTTQIGKANERMQLPAYVAGLALFRDTVRRLLG